MIFYDSLISCNKVTSWFIKKLFKYKQPKTMIKILNLSFVYMQMNTSFETRSVRKLLRDKSTGGVTERICTWKGERIEYS